MNALLLVASREMRERGRDRSFVIGMLVTLAIVMAAAILPSLVGGGPDTATVGVVSAADRAVAETAARQAPQAGAKLTIREFPDRAAAERAVRGGDVRVALAGDELLVRDDPSGTAVQLMQGASSRARAADALASAGAKPATVTEVLDQRPLPVRSLDPAADERASREALAFVGLLLLFVSTLGFAVTVAFGVVEEKSSRVVEVLLAAVRPRDLLGGKVLGLGALGLGQIVVIAVPGILTATMLGTLDLPASSSPGFLLTLAVWFVLGFGIYAAAFASAGALVSRQEDLQTVITPISLLMQGAFALGFVASHSPDGIVAQVATFVPITAPMVAPTRYARGGLPLWEHLLAVAATAVGAVLLVALAARIYERTILRTGARVRWRDALRG